MVLILALALVGLVLGPLVGVVVDRAVERETPAGEHRCPTCRASLGSASLIPVRSWFVACPEDTTHSQRRYPLTDLALAASFALAGWRFGPTWILVPYLLLFASLVAMSVIDLETKLLLDVLTYPTIGLGLFLVLTLSGPNDFADGIWPALIGAGLFTLILGLAFLAYPPGMGLGDVKLAPTLGLAMGWVAADGLSAARMVIYALAVGMLALGVIGLVVGRATGEGRKTELPAGPFLVLATMVLIAVSDPTITELGVGIQS